MTDLAYCDRQRRQAAATALDRESTGKQASMAETAAQMLTAAAPALVRRCDDSGDADIQRVPGFLYRITISSPPHMSHLAWRPHGYDSSAACAYIAVSSRSTTVTSGSPMRVPPILSTTP